MLGFSLHTTEKSQFAWIHTGHGFDAPARESVNSVYCTSHKQARGVTYGTFEAYLHLWPIPLGRYTRSQNSRFYNPCQQSSQGFSGLKDSLVLAKWGKSGSEKRRSIWGAWVARVLIVWIGSLDLTNVAVIVIIVSVVVFIAFVVASTALLKGIGVRFRNRRCSS